MARTTITLSVDLEIKEKAYAILRSKGIKPSRCVQSCLEEVIKNNMKGGS